MALPVAGAFDSEIGSVDTAWPKGPLHAALYPRVLEDVRATHAALVETACESSSAEPSTESTVGVDRVLANARRLGWILGVLSAAGGTDLLFERRERDGARWLFACVAATLAERGLRLPEADRPVESLHAAEGGWKVPWACANLLYGAALSGVPQGWSLRYACSQLVFSCRRPADLAVRVLGRAIESSIEGASFRATLGSFAMTFESTATRAEGSTAR